MMSKGSAASRSCWKAAIIASVIIIIILWFTSDGGSLNGPLYIMELAGNSQLDPISKLLKTEKIVDNRDGHMGPYNLSSNATDFSEGQSAVILKHLNGKKQGTFLEAGGYDGEFLSNSFALEFQNGFTGILVEPQKKAFEKMLTRHRKVGMLNACISPTGQQYTANMTISLADNDYDKGSSALTGFKRVGGAQHEIVPVDCYPLINILEAAGLTKLDVLCLDVQGTEVDILKTFPWEKVEITLLVIEDDFQEPDIHKKVLDETKAILGKQGYTMVEHISTDYFFKKV